MARPVFLRVKRPFDEQPSRQVHGPVNGTEPCASESVDSAAPMCLDGEVKLLSDLFSDPSWSHVVERFDLTQRQAEVAGLMCRGCQDKEIGRLLGITSHGVRRHVRELFRKLCVDRRIGIVVRLVLASRPNASEAH